MQKPIFTNSSIVFIGFYILSRKNNFDLMLPSTIKASKSPKISQGIKKQNSNFKRSLRKCSTNYSIKSLFTLNLFSSSNSSSPHHHSFNKDWQEL